jgi:hypothetical protein
MTLAVNTSLLARFGLDWFGPPGEPPAAPAAPSPVTPRVSLLAASALVAPLHEALAGLPSRADIGAVATQARALYREVVGEGVRDETPRAAEAAIVERGSGRVSSGSLFDPGTAPSREAPGEARAGSALAAPREDLRDLAQQVRMWFAGLVALATTGRVGESEDLVRRRRRQLLRAVAIARRRIRARRPAPTPQRRAFDAYREA